MLKVNLITLNLTIAVLLASVLPATSTEKIDCSKPSNTFAINHCLQLEYKAADRKLNQVYQSLLKALKSWEAEVKRSDSEQVKSLRKAQRQWIVFRDQNCLFHSNMGFGGTISGTNYWSCMVSMTEERSEEFARALQNT